MVTVYFQMLTWRQNIDVVAWVLYRIVPVSQRSTHITSRKHDVITGLKLEKQGWIFRSLRTNVCCVQFMFRAYVLLESLVTTLSKFVKIHKWEYLQICSNIKKMTFSGHLAWCNIMRSKNDHNEILTGSHLPLSTRPLPLQLPPPSKFLSDAFQVLPHKHAGWEVPSYKRTIVTSWSRTLLVLTVEFRVNCRAWVEM